MRIIQVYKTSKGYFHHFSEANKPENKHKQHLVSNGKIIEDYENPEVAWVLEDVLSVCFELKMIEVSRKV